MKIRILQCDPIDPQAEDQVHRIRHQTGDLVIEYIQIQERQPSRKMGSDNSMFLESCGSAAGRFLSPANFNYQSSTAGRLSILADSQSIDGPLEWRMAGQNDQSISA